MTVEKEKMFEKSKTSLQVERIKLDSVQNGTDDEIHSDGIDHDEIKLTTCLNELDEKAKH